MNIILLEDGQTFLPIGDRRAEHIIKVLRLGEGDSFRGGIRNSCFLDCKVEKIDGKGITFSSEKGQDGSHLFPLTMILAQVRPICMRRMLRELASMGLSHLVLTRSDLGEKSYAQAGLYTEGLWRDIVDDGVMQSGFTGVMDVSFAGGVEDAVSSCGGGVRLLFDNVAGTSGVFDVETGSEGAVVAIGPERGWSDRERKVFLDAGFLPVLLGKRILRTETAAVAAASAVLGKMRLI